MQVQDSIPWVPPCEGSLFRCYFWPLAEIRVRFLPLKQAAPLLYNAGVSEMPSSHLNPQSSLPGKHFGRVVQFQLTVIAHIFYFAFLSNTQIFYSSCYIRCI